jgi:hypothetical protein
MCSNMFQYLAMLLNKCQFDKKIRLTLPILSQPNYGYDVDNTKFSLVLNPFILIIVQK